MNEKQRLEIMEPLKKAMYYGPDKHYAKHAELCRRIWRGREVWSAGYAWVRCFGNIIYPRWLGHGDTPEAAVAAAVAKLEKAAK